MLEPAAVIPAENHQRTDAGGAEIVYGESQHAVEDAAIGVVQATAGLLQP